MNREPRIAATLERPTLVWELDDTDPPTFVLLPGQKLTIGRDASNSIVIESSFVSKFHAAVHWRGGECLVEDLGSSNGTHVNGLPIRVSELSEGDLIEIGDQKFRIRDTSTGRRAKRPGAKTTNTGGNKAVRLGLTAVVTLVGMTTLLTSLAPKRKSATPEAPRVRQQEVVVPERPAEAPEVAADANTSALVEAVRAKAAASGVQVQDALFDEAQTRYVAGRLLDAHVLYDAARKNQPPHALAERRFAQVGRDLERAIAVHQAEAERSHAQLRYDDAVVEWEQVVQLTDARDPRHAQAAQALTRAREKKPK